MTLNELVTRAHVRALKSGWWEEPQRTPLEIHMLIVSEIAEATEACRRGEPPFWIQSINGKPEGEAVELIDAIIRIADYFGHKGWDLEEILLSKMEYNDSRPHRHGGKKY